LWDFNKAQDFLSVNGEAANGGSVESDGPVVGNDKVLVNSDGSFGSRMGGNVLSVFGAD
jgi:polyvinyl alcohol dehydrogenase (cytochrome)